MFVPWVALGLLGTGLGELAPSLVPTPIVGGEPVAGDTWHSAVVVDFGVDLCTGTLVAEHLVLTAAHCLQSSPPAELLQIKLGNSRAEPELVLPVSRYALDPEFCANVFECGLDLHDFAYLELAEPAPADAVVPRLPTEQATWDAAMAPGTVVLVGFGYDAELESGIKRFVEADVRGSTASGLELLAGGDGKDGCQGDSGGPAYARLPSGEEVLVGVSSRGLACGEGGYYGTTPSALCWIGEELGIVWDAGTDACSVDTTPSRTEQERGCSIGPARETGHAWVSLMLAMAWRRRRPVELGARDDGIRPGCELDRFVEQ
jgi:hypothetical protein